MFRTRYRHYSKQTKKSNIEIILCGDINIDYLDENCHKRQQLDALLATYNSIGTVRFPTKSLNGSLSAIDNIFIDISHEGKCALYRLINGLSDHDGQIIQLESKCMQKQPNEFRSIQNINKRYMKDFKTKLSYEIWDTIFGDNDVNRIFNNFHNTFLRIFYSRFPKKKIQIKKREYLDVKRYEDI